MQSFLQYRKIGLAVRKSIIHDHEKNDPESNLSVDGVPSNQQAQLETNISTLLELTHTKTLDISPSDSNANRKFMHTAFGLSLNGIHPRDRTTHEGKNGKVFVVGWEGEDDPSNPRNWSSSYRVFATLIVASISFAVGAASSADTAVLPQAAAHFGVSEVVEALAIGVFLVGFAVGAIFAGPLSETFGRNAVYIATMFVFMIFVMASALAPNLGAQLAFRFLAGVVGSTPLTCAGGSISDMWPPLEKTFAFPIFAICGFGGPIMGPVIASYVIKLGTWRWAEWIILIISALVLILIILFQPETYSPILLKWKAKHLRQETGDQRFKAEIEIVHKALGGQLIVALSRPLHFSLEPVVICLTLYLTVLYIVLFTFLDGYSYIFQQVYDISQGLTNVIFTGLFVGVLCGGLIVPLVYKKTKTAFIQNSFVPEVRLWFGMLGAPAIPISLFWMGWTDYSSISIWSPIMASVLLGYGIVCVFMTVYMYIIDLYEVYAASALTFVTFTRYVIAGGMTVVGVPFYKNLGPHWTITILGAISVLMTPTPYLLYRWGHLVRARSKYVAS